MGTAALTQQQTARRTNARGNADEIYLRVRGVDLYGPSLLQIQQSCMEILRTGGGEGDGADSRNMTQSATTTGTTNSAPAGEKRGRKPMSAAARKKLSLAVKARFAAKRQQAQQATTNTPQPGRKSHKAAAATV